MGGGNGVPGRGTRLGQGREVSVWGRVGGWVKQEKRLGTQILS